jgi:hypothetical protein
MGVDAYGGAAATVTNSGTISATGGDAILLGGGGLVVAQAGGVFNGLVDGGGTAATLELGSGETLSGLGAGNGFTRFNTVLFDSGAQKISGSATGVNGPTFASFAIGDTIEVTGAVDTAGTFSGGTLTLTGSAPTSLVFSGIGGTPHVTNDGTNTDVTLVPCFCAGTRLLTDAGEVAVEDLRAGMRVISYQDRQAMPVTWVGHRRIDCTRHPRPRDVWPIRIAAGAFGEAVPHRPLYVSPDHAVFVDGALVPARYLVNGTSVAQIPCDEVVYFHVEVADHGVLVAEGLPAESYLDTGNRDLFADESADRAAAAVLSA